MLKTLYESKSLLIAGPSLLTAELERFYGKLAFPEVHGRPYVIGNFVTSVDGLITSDKGMPNPLFGNPEDRLLMSILRALSDAVVVGKSTLSDAPGHETWHWKTTVPKVHEDTLVTFANRLDKHEAHKSVFVSASGTGFGTKRQVFHDSDVDAIVASTTIGSKRLSEEFSALSGSPKIEIWPLDGKEGGVDLKALLAKLYRGGSNLILLEGGPRLYGDFEKAGLVDEIFLSQRALVVGNGKDSRRPTFSGFSYPSGVEKKMNLLSLKKGEGDMLFSRWQYR